MQQVLYSNRSAIHEIKKTHLRGLRVVFFLCNSFLQATGVLK